MKAVGAFGIVVVFAALLTVGAAARTAGASDAARPSREEPRHGEKRGAPPRAAKEVPAEKNGPFPIRVRFELQRDFGFHIGDEVPLDVVLTLDPGTIVDLVKLPGVGDFHGPFQVRRFRVVPGREGEFKTYRIHYVVQLFRPALAVDRVQFPPLEILYARTAVHPPPGGYRYHSLLTPALSLEFSRTASYSSTMREIKGPLEDPRPVRTWGAFAVGLLLLSFGAGSWGRDLYRRRRERDRMRELAPAEKALMAFREAQHKYLIEDDNVYFLFVEVSRTFRSFLSEMFRVPALNLTPEQIRESFTGSPRQVEIVDALKQCNKILYEGREPNAFEREQLMNRLQALVVDLSCANGTGGSREAYGGGNGHHAPC